MPPDDTPSPDNEPWWMEALRLAAAGAAGAATAAALDAFFAKEYAGLIIGPFLFARKMKKESQSVKLLRFQSPR